LQKGQKKGLRGKRNKGLPMNSVRYEATRGLRGEGHWGKKLPNIGNKGLRKGGFGVTRGKKGDNAIGRNSGG